MFPPGFQNGNRLCDKFYAHKIMHCRPSQNFGFMSMTVTIDLFENSNPRFFILDIFKNVHFQKVRPFLFGGFYISRERNQKVSKFEDFLDQSRRILEKFRKKIPKLVPENIFVYFCTESIEGRRGRYCIGTEILYINTLTDG